MKRKLLIMLMAASLLFSFGGCGKEQAPQSEGPADTPKAEESSDEGLMTQDYFAGEVGEEVLGYYADDYDGDGVQEAFAVTGEPDSDFGLIDNARLYYIHGFEIEMLAETYGFLPQEPVLDTGAGSKVFIFEESGGGSGSLSYIYGVNANAVHASAISQQYECFGANSAAYVDENSMGEFESRAEYGFVAFESSFELGYHQYLPVYFEYKDGDFAEAYRETSDGGSDAGSEVTQPDEALQGVTVYFTSGESAETFEVKNKHLIVKLDNGQEFDQVEVESLQMDLQAQGKWKGSGKSSLDLPLAEDCDWSRIYVTDLIAAKGEPIHFSDIKADVESARDYDWGFGLLIYVRDGKIVKVAEGYS